jgi:hypothetical protein
MPISKITTSGTFNLKLSSAGYIQAISVPQAGTSWTLTLNDGPNPAGNVTTIYGATPAAITVNLGVLTPLFFTQGLQVVTAGATPGEMEIEWS